MAATSVRGWRRRCQSGQRTLEIVKRSDQAKGFHLLPRRWVVERTFAWLGRNRRLSKDFEATITSSEAWLYLAIHASQQPWLPFGNGIDFKPLRATQETGAWTVLFRCAKGSGFPRHEHLGAGEYYMVSGKMEIRGGVENGGITAYGGDYGYEPNGMIHDFTNFPEETILYFTNYGPIRFMDDDNHTLHVLDWQGILKMAEDRRKKVTA